ncbi:transcription termination/antitermination protein NusG [Sulfuriroseicoccus oceanibius]|uniref:KOW motif-containing protein n=1 Tax=Sulfuriroseicoccus oceanibius TaxID=2707525 RepID=A0A6B3LBH5_9BACT|nr:transcription termination/antitermination NusG family protein [Sulfuriroseicoccus oceanibius]QQL45610.1 KOW motif-containing protein [Sulfuriroseicoccus oceanibius]
MSKSSEQEIEYGWICARTQKKSEHIAAATLSQMEDVEAFCPRLKFKRKTKRGVVWFTEAMFPCYIFVRCPLGGSFSAVRYARGVVGLVEFAGEVPTIPDHQIEALRQLVGDDDVRVIEKAVEPGQEVEVTEGPLKGLVAVVTQVLPATDRVRLLLEFLGQSREIEVPIDSVIPPKRPKGE